jgi:hypothetical protein
MNRPPHHETNYKFISPHDRLYRDCLKDVQWVEEKPNYLHAVSVLGCLFMVTLVLVLLSY